MEKRHSIVVILQLHSQDEYMDIPERLCSNADLMLAHRLRRWSNIKSTLEQSLVFAGYRVGYSMCFI